MSSKLFRGVILGAPASGKGTISSRIVKCFDIKHLASGDLLRNHIQDNTQLGKEAKKFVENGLLVPDTFMVNLISEELKKLARFNWLLDGFPRTVSQAKEFHAKHPLDVALNLVVPFEVIIGRAAGRRIHVASGRIYNTDFNPPKEEGIDDVTGERLLQRPDDKPEAVRKRLEIYKETVDPVLDYFRGKGILEEFCGKTSDEIWPQVRGFLETRIKMKENGK